MHPPPNSRDLANGRLVKRNLGIYFAEIMLMVDVNGFILKISMNLQIVLVHKEKWKYMEFGYRAAEPE
jgi:hypothetical protein